MKEEQSMELLINFDNCLDIDANLSAALGALLDKLVIDFNKKIYVKKPFNRNPRKKLSRIGFLKAWEVLTDIEERENFIKYRRFNVGDSDEFKKYVFDDLIQKKRFPQCTRKAAEKIIESIYELFVNATSHSESRYVYTCGECHERNKLPMLDMTLVNLGKTIPENVNTFLKNKGETPLSPCECMIWAFKEGNTTKEIPGGLGLAILKDFIDLNEGVIQMVSGNALINYHNRKFDKILLEMEFPGTIVNVEFNCADKKSYFYGDNDVENLQDLF